MRRIVIIGSSGWMGKAMIQSLVNLYTPTILNSIEPYASAVRKVELISGITYQTKILSEFDYSADIDIFMPFAFLTQEKFDLLGKDIYSSTNRALIDFYVDVVSRVKIDSIIKLTSGIVLDKFVHLDRAESFHEYKRLKFRESNELQQVIDARGVNALTCHLFNISGAHITHPNVYALGNFILQAKQLGRIRVNSKFSVYRKYVLDEDLCQLLLRMIESREFVNFESSGQIVEIHHLARQIANLLSVECVEDKYDSSSRSDNYFSENDNMKVLMDKFNVKETKLEQQIIETIRGIRFYEQV